MSCDYCNSNTISLRLCSSCHSVGYCNSSCQELDWHDHKRFCKKQKTEKRTTGIFYRKVAVLDYLPKEAISSLVSNIEINQPCPMEVCKFDNTSIDYDYLTFHIFPDTPMPIDTDMFIASENQKSIIPTIKEWIQTFQFIKPVERILFKDCDPEWIFHFKVLSLMRSCNLDKRFILMSQIIKKERLTRELVWKSNTIDKMNSLKVGSVLWIVSRIGLDTEPGKQVFVDSANAHMITCSVMEKFVGVSIADIMKSSSICKPFMDKICNDYKDDFQALLI